MKFLLTLVFLTVFFITNALSQINIKAVQYRDCFACNPDGLKNIIICNVGVQFTNSDKSNAYYLRLNQINFVGADNCLWSTQTPTNEVRLRPNDGQAQGNSYNHHLEFDPWKIGCCSKCDGSTKISRLSIPIYDGNNTNKISDLVFEIRICCGSEIFCTPTSIIEVLKNYEMNINVWPNPVTSALNFTFIAPNTGKAIIKIVDLLGYSYMEYSAFINEGMNNIDMNISSLPNGAYMLVVRLGIGSNAYYDFKKIVVKK